MNFFKNTGLMLLLFFVVLCNAQDWQFQDLKISSKNKRLMLDAKRLKTPYFDEIIENIHYSCVASFELYPLHKCQNGEISFTYKGSQFHAIFNGWFNFANNSWDVSINNPEKTLFLNSNSQHASKLNLSLVAIDLEKFPPPVLAALAIDPNQSSATLSAELEVDFEQSLQISADYQLTNLSWESEDGSFVFAENDLLGQLHYQQNQNGARLKSTTTFSSGEGLFADIYVDFSQNPVTISSSIDLDDAFNPTVTQLLFSSTDAIKVALDIPDLSTNDVKISYEISDLKLLYDGFLKSYLEILGIDELDIIGQAEGFITIENAEIIALSTTLADLSLEMVAKRTEIENLKGQLNWHKQGQWQTSKLAWDALLLAGMPINQSDLQFKTTGQQLQVQQNTSIPIFDGSLKINQLHLTDLFKNEIAIDFDGEVEPISLALITEKMGWPIMQGSIAGKIPGMKKVGHSITFDGTLLLNVFAGKLQIDNLSIERLFGIAPVVAADIRFSGLNLSQITSTFDFGEITGLIEGYVTGLRITNWKPDRLNAHIQSLKSKGIKQTISQRAIDNISSIGGIQGALSRSFLRFFDSFKYKKIGIGCKLRNSICEMSGIKNADGNQNIYHLIQGSGIPSINIIGFQKFIDWEVFLDRLLNANY